MKFWDELINSFSPWANMKIENPNPSYLINVLTKCHLCNFMSQCSNWPLYEIAEAGSVLGSFQIYFNLKNNIFSNLIIHFIVSFQICFNLKNKIFSNLIINFIVSFQFSLSFQLCLMNKIKINEILLMY